MPLAKNKNKVGLGNSLMNDRFGKGKGQDMRRGPKGIERVAPDGSTYITTPKQEASWMKMRSITEQAALDEFLATAELAGTDFTAEKMNNVKIIHKDQKNPYLLSAAEERATTKKQNANKQRLKVPRRPQWDDKMTAVELDERERQSLLEWRRGLAQLQDTDDLLMTPFERNIEVWRQLWRVIERSDLIVQIVDARNPLLYRCEDLESYVKDVDEKKNNLLLVNKADMMTLRQRQTWANFFEKQGINFRFFSAKLAKDVNEGNVMPEDDHDDSEKAKVTTDARADVSAATSKLRIEDDESESDEDSEEEDDDEEDEESSDGEEDEDSEEEEEEEDSDEDEDTDSDDEIPVPHSHRMSSSESTRIITTDELESLFLQHAPAVEGNTDDDRPRKTTVGLVGYPNVGKSSTINALIGAKKVSVSATPGKTKHFQTIHLSEQVILCDCPGLVFPNFANTKAELVCNGVLPIDQMREYTGPAGLVAQRIPKAFLQAIYGMKIQTRPIEEGGTGHPTGEEVLRAYATARGFSTQGLGQPDESRAARYVLKDYVNGKLLFCHPPPSDPPIDPKLFNSELYDVHHLPERRKAAFEASDAGNADELESVSGLPFVPGEGRKTQTLDKRFFARGQGNAGHLTKPMHQRMSEQPLAGGRQLTGRKLKEIVALEKDVDVADLKMSSKKHFKANKRRAKKERSEYV